MLAVKAVVEAAGIVALLVALAIVEVPPALQRCRAVLPRFVEVERAVAAVPAALVVVALAVTHAVSRASVAVIDLAACLHLRRRRDVVAAAANEGVVKHVAEQAVELRRADAVVVGRLAGVLAGAAVVAGVALARAVGWVLALWPSEGRRAQAERVLVAGDAGAAVTAVQCATRVSVTLASGASESLRE